ncbi:galactose-1-phosphate uridylyltransferase [bacterium]
MPELRKDPVMGRWVIISTARGQRPFQYTKHKDISDEKTCPFCYGNEHMTPPEIAAYRKHGSEKNTKGWTVRVVPNRFPALQIEGELNKTGEGMYDKMNGIGAHEVIIETPQHNKDMGDLDNKSVQQILGMYKDRILDLKKDDRFEYVLIFKNKGFSAGASLSHIHSQLIALPIVPKRVNEELVGAKKYFDYKERCVFCDMINEERNFYKRVIVENDTFIAFCPFASRFPFEVWILPKEHVQYFYKITDKQSSDCADILRVVMYKIDKVLAVPPYNYIVHDSPFRMDVSPYYHWHIEIIPKLTKVAGFEWGSGFYINPTHPEEAAAFLRDQD